jgi:predicted neuraminidase
VPSVPAVLDGPAELVDANTLPPQLDPALPPQLGPAVISDTLVSAPGAGRNGVHAPTVAVLGDGTLLAAWYAYVGPQELTGSAIFAARRPVDTGVWSEPTLLADRPIGDGNPVLYAEGQRAWFFQAVVPLGWSTAHVETQTSDDGGLTWSGATTLPGPLGTNARFPPVRLRDGRLLLPAYSDLTQQALFFDSADGASWRLLATVGAPWPLGCIQPAVALRGDGSVLAALRNYGGDWLWLADSTDGGRTWSPPRDAGLPNPGSAAQLLRLASGRLALIFNDSPTARHPLSIALSDDDGRTWAHRQVLVDGPDEYSYPSAVQTPDGVLHVLYSADRRAIRHLIVSEARLLDGP